MKLSSPIVGNLVSIPILHDKRSLVIKNAVEMGYYETPKKCNQSDIAEFFGLKQATVAEHLQHAENIIVHSWAEQVPSSKPSKRN